LDPVCLLLYPATQSSLQMIFFTSKTSLVEIGDHPYQLGLSIVLPSQKYVGIR
jgi:hypothetical protein